MKIFIAIGAVVLTVLIAAQFVTIFVIQPIGAVPQGRTLIISRLTTLHFIDSADAWCDRTQGGVSLICRLGVLGRVGKEANVIARLPYSQTLYEISTSGKTYDR
ncbi:hypothetical protein [Xanthobacter autotrophicus]|uniref:hypothetical protein n=1 Tax=Xanthobacter autotrophicus TaxID=280 RepID=UPI00372721BC